MHPQRSNLLPGREGGLLRRLGGLLAKTFLAGGGLLRWPGGLLARTFLNVIASVGAYAPPREAISYQAKRADCFVGLAASSQGHSLMSLRAWVLMHPHAKQSPARREGGLLRRPGGLLARTLKGIFASVDAYAPTRDMRRPLNALWYRRDMFRQLSPIRAQSNPNLVQAKARQRQRG